MTKKTLDLSQKQNPRAFKERASTYLRRDTMELPPEVVERFAADGYTLRWVRSNLGVGGPADIKNLGRRAMMGYVPVTISEVPEFAPFSTRRDVNLPGMAEAFSYTDVISQGDVILMKCPVEYVQEYRDDSLRRAELENNAVSRKAQREGLMDESSTHITQGGRTISPRRGKTVSFASDE